MGGLHPLLYESFLQQPDVFQGGSEFFQLMGSLVIRTTSDVRAHVADIATSVKQFVKEMDPDQPVTDISTMNEVLAKSMKDYKNYVVVLGFLAGIAVVLAAIGVYGVLSYFVNQRTRELGLRIAWRCAAALRSVEFHAFGLSLRLNPRLFCDRAIERVVAEYLRGGRGGG